MAKAKHNHRFVVGYPVARHRVYGKDKGNWIDLMTKSQAVGRLRDIPDKNAIIYELVEVE